MKGISKGRGCEIEITRKSDIIVFKLRAGELANLHAGQWFTLSTGRKLIFFEIFIVTDTYKRITNKQDLVYFSYKRVSICEIWISTFKR